MLRCTLEIERERDRNKEGERDGEEGEIEKVGERRKGEKEIVISENERCRKENKRSLERDICGGKKR